MELNCIQSPQLSPLNELPQNPGRTEGKWHFISLRFALQGKKGGGEKSPEMESGIMNSNKTQSTKEYFYIHLNGKWEQKGIVV